MRLPHTTLVRACQRDNSVTGAAAAREHVAAFSDMDRADQISGYYLGCHKVQQQCMHMR